MTRSFHVYIHPMLRLSSLWSAVLLLSLAATSVAAGLTEGLAAAQEGDYDSAFRELEPIARQGNPEAQYHVGVMYDTGRGVAQNAARAFQWYSAAARQGHGKAQHNVAVMYNEGRGVGANHELALQWFLKAAQQGVPDAQFNLGVMYANGTGIAQDYAQAAQWYRKAAEQGDADAQYNLALLYGTGKGISPDLVQAWAWFDTAFTRAGAPNAKKNRDLTAQRLSPAQLEQAKKLAGEYAVKFVTPFKESKKK